MTISSSIELYDNFSGVFTSMSSAMNLMLSGLNDVESAMNGNINMTSFDASRSKIQEAEAAVKSFQDYLTGLKENTNIPPLNIPVQWNNTEIPVFDTTGVERYSQELNNANSLVNTLANNQKTINANAVNILPKDAITNLENVNTRITEVQQRIQQISSKPLDVVSNEESNELENLRNQLNQALQYQKQLNQAVNNMDVQAANTAYNQLSSTVSNTKRYIRDSMTEQGYFNRKIAEGTTASGTLLSRIKNIAKMYLGIQGIRIGINFYKESINSANAQIEAEQKLETIMNQRMHSTAQQINDIKELTSAQQALGVVGDEVQLAGAQQLSTFLQTEGALKTLLPAMNNLAVQQGGVNVTSEKLVSIGNMMGKVMQGQTSALTRVGITFTEAQEQALKYGTEEERAATLAQVITDNVGNMNEVMSNTPAGKIQQISNAWSDMKETIGGQLYPAILAFFDALNTNLPALAPIFTGITFAVSLVLYALSGVLRVVGAIFSFVSDNWDIISPIIYGIAAALAVYYGKLLLVKGIELASAAASTAMAVGKGVLTAATMLASGATLAQTAAQLGLNGAMYACPIVWIIMLIIALIAIIFAVCAAIARSSDTADSAFGVMCGGVMVVISFFKNLGLSIANIALGIFEAIKALCSNVKTAFHNAICSVQGFWYDLLSTAMSVIEKICSALNKLPFVEFDYSGITAAADNYAAKAEAARNNKSEYASVQAAYDKGASKFDTFQTGWASEAFAAGAAWGDNKSEALSNKITDFKDMLNPDDDATNRGEQVLNGYDDSYESGNEGYGTETGADKGLKDSSADTAKNTKKIADNTKKSDDILSMIKDYVSRERIASYTTKQINVDMSGMSNKIASSLSIADVVKQMEEAIAEGAAVAAEGV